MNRVTLRALSPGLAALAVLALSACAATPDHRALGAASSGAPQPVEGYDWFLNDDPEEPRLSYGYVQSDDVPFSLMCAPGSGKVRLALQGDAGGRGAITIESGGETEAYAAVAEPSEMHDGVHMIASAASADPVFQRFGRLGWLAVWKGEERLMMASQPGSAPRAAQFLALCG